MGRKKKPTSEVSGLYRPLSYVSQFAKWFCMKCNTKVSSKKSKLTGRYYRPSKCPNCKGTRTFVALKGEEKLDLG